MADSKYKALLRELKAKIFAGGYDGEHAFHGKLQQRLADSEEVDELLRMVLPAYRPQAFAYTAGQDDTIVIVVFHGSEWLSSKGKYTMF